MLVLLYFVSQVKCNKCFELCNTNLSLFVCVCVCVPQTGGCGRRDFDTWAVKRERGRYFNFDSGKSVFLSGYSVQGISLHGF